MSLKTIRIQGKGTVTQTPDRVRILFIVSGKDPDFGKAVEKCNVGVIATRAAAESVGIESSRVKSAYFDVREDTEYYSGRTHHVGFDSHHELVVELPIDKALVGRLISAVVKTKTNPKISLKFEVTDAEALKQRVLTAAIENASRRASTIATASGIKLGTILNIEYGQFEVRISSRSNEMICESVDCSTDSGPDFDPEDLKAEDSVTITWEIES